MKRILSDRNKRSRALSFAIVIAAWIVFETLTLTGGLSKLAISLLVPVCCYVVAALGLGLNVGFSGELHLGQAGFMSIGAFTGIILSSVLSNAISNTAVRLLLAIAAGSLLSALFGYLIGIPVLRLQGDYLAIVTLAFGEIIKRLITNLYVGYDAAGLHFAFVTNSMKLLSGGKMLINGPMGANSVEKISTFTAGILLVLAALLICWNILGSRSGRAIVACRDDRVAAASIGINVTKTKMLAFVLSAGMAGAAGALFGLNYSTVMATNFSFNTSILILVYVVLGGLGSINGTILATAILVVLPEILRPLQNYRMLLYSVILIAIMLISNNPQVKTLLERFRAKRSGGKEHG